MEKKCILNLLEISHFGRSVEININVKLFLRYIHGGFLWLDRPVSIETQLIMWIIGLPLAWEDPLPLFTNKYKEKSLAEKMKDKYDTHRGARGLDISSIKDDIFRFAMYVMACKLLRKCHKDQVPKSAIETTEKCIAGVQMNWVMFLVNQFLMDCREVQDKGKKIHYAWLLILIALVAWREPKDTQFMVFSKKPCLVVRYVNLWHIAHK
jgi:hypothetical protein